MNFSSHFVILINASNLKIFFLTKNLREPFLTDFTKQSGELTVHLQRSNLPVTNRFKLKMLSQYILRFEHHKSLLATKELSSRFFCYRILPTDYTNEITPISKKSLLRFSCSKESRILKSFVEQGLSGPY